MTTPTTPTTTDQQIDFLIDLGTKLQGITTTLTALGDAQTEIDLEHPYFDGVLTEKLHTLTQQALATTEFVVDLARRAALKKFQDDVEALMVKSGNVLDDLQSGKAFGFESQEEEETDPPPTRTKVQ